VPLHGDLFSNKLIMGKQFFFVILMLCSLFIKAQKTLKEDKVYIDSISPAKLFDDTPVGLGLLIGNNQNFDKKHRPEITITPPTIISAEKNDKGELSIQAYINSDNINIIAKGINSKNRNNYRAFRQTPEQGYEIEQPLVVSERNQTLIADEYINDHEKLFLFPFGSTFYYTIKDKSDSIISTLKLGFVFPQPEPWILSIDEKFLTMLEYNPSASSFFDPQSIESFRKQLSSANPANAKINPETGLPQKLVLPSNKNSFFLIFKKLTGAKTYLEYKLSNDSAWKVTANTAAPSILLKDLAIGNYKLAVRFPLSESWEYEFEIKPHWTQTTAFKVVLGILITALISWVFFRIHNKRQKAKLRQEVAQRKQVQNQIQSLRSQLDPHFIFNSLSSIQSLINRNDIEAANLYISKFGALLHEILEKSDTMMHPLALELQQVEHYLQLEQLRFKFEYHIDVASSLNPSEIDIPIMLLQPYIENSIKHGIADKREQGQIELSVVRQESTMVISISDNGIGYDAANKGEGHGNRLVAERIEMVNKLLNNQQITIELNSEKGKGTKITIYFANWL
jgi:two-component system, LytTR family, sensor kinase